MKRNINFGYALQIILSFVALLFGISTIAIGDFMYVSQAFIALTFMVMGFNYYTIMNKTKEAMIFFLMGVVIMAITLAKVM